MENTDNQNSTNHVAKTKLFKSGFQGASGNDERGSENAVFMQALSILIMLFDNKMITLDNSAFIRTNVRINAEFTEAEQVILNLVQNNEGKLAGDLQ